MSEMSNLEARAVDLELRFMKLQRELHDLSDVVAAQQRTIDALRREAEQRRERAGSESAEDRPYEETPPHY